MYHTEFNNVGIKAICACVPTLISENRDRTDLYPEKTLKKFIKTTGIEQRRFSQSNQCASDFCFVAAEHLLNNGIKKTDIDIVIFVSQTPDYQLPATSIILQNRLGLNTNCGAFDINMGCSGYVYGLFTAFSLVSNIGIDNVLLLVGDTPTKFVNEQDKSTGILFGDGGSATVIGKSDVYGKSFFNLFSDGSGEDALKIDSGGYRNQVNSKSLDIQEYADGSIRNDLQLHMNGTDVFNFTITKVPEGISNLLNVTKTDIDEIDYWIFHQANKFIIDCVCQKINVPLEKVPMSINKFGNTSCLSIPLTIVSELVDKPHSDKKLFLSGFGVGLSYANAILDTGNLYISELIEL